MNKYLSIIITAFWLVMFASAVHQIPEPVTEEPGWGMFAGACVFIISMFLAGWLWAKDEK